MSDDDTPTPAEDPRPDAGAVGAPVVTTIGPSRFPTEVAVVGAAVVALLVAGVVTLLAISGGGDDDRITIGSEADRPSPTFDASIGSGDDPVSGSGRDISITDEPIVIDADGNVVDPSGGNAGAALPSEQDQGRAEGLDLPDDAFTGATADSTPGTGQPVGTALSSTPDDGEGTDSDGDDDAGTNLLGGDDPEDKRMPDLICRGLQAAQDEIQDRGVFGSKSEDATGEGRRQIWDRNWVVVAQDPEPGEKIGEFEAILYVVKKSDDENICD